MTRYADGYAPKLEPLRVKRVTLMETADYRLYQQQRISGYDSPAPVGTFLFCKKCEKQWFDCNHWHDKGNGWVIGGGVAEIWQLYNMLITLDRL